MIEALTEVLAEENGLIKVITVSVIIFFPALIVLRFLLFMILPRGILKKFFTK